MTWIRCEVATMAKTTAKISPYSAVGIVAAQSLGEPGTQMTMRTFHYAGVAEHVPTGLPRLIELVDAKKEPKKSVVEVRLLKEYRTKESNAKALTKEMESVLLPEVASMQEDMGAQRLLIKLKKDDAKALGVTMEMLREAVKKTVAAGKVEARGDKISVRLKGEKEKPLKELRKTAVKLRKTLVKGISGIKRSVVIKEKGEYFIRASGSNIKDLMKLKRVDPSMIYTNSVMEIEKTFGVEAARNAIVKEMHNVMELQGLAVDIRHIMLLADAMTSDGKVKSIGRHGLSGEKAGVMGRAAFEETIKHLVNASIIGEDDNLVGVTENIIVGQTIPIGTGRIRLGMSIQK
jgi:DNA-directed RNA polymerase subunit A"